MGQVVLLQMSYTADTGTVYPESVWLPDDVNEDVIDQQGGIQWYGWGNQADFLAKNAQVGQHLVSVSKAAFVAGSQQTDAQICAAAGMPTGNITEAQNTAALAVGLSLATLDTPAPPNADGTPALNPDGTPKMQSFFAGASPVTVTVPD